VKMVPKQRKGGRPPSYRPEACRVAERGTTQPEIAAELGVTNRTLSRWALKYPEFRAALDRGLVRRAAERRWAETAPLRAAASELRRMIADAATFDDLGDSARVDQAAVLPDDPTGSDATQSPPRDLSTTPSPEERRAARRSTRYMLPDPEPDLAFDGEPVELLDPRAGW
jgi:transposase-like protein